MLLVCFFTALLIFFGGIILSVFAARAGLDNGSKPVNHVFAGTFISSTVLFLPIYSKYFEGTDLIWIKTILLSIHNSIRIFIVDGEFDIVHNTLLETGHWIATPYTILFALIYITAPILTFSIVLSLVKDLSAFLNVCFTFFGKIYIFSEMNEQSIALARSIKEKEKRSKIVFTNVTNLESDNNNALVQKIKQIRGIIFKKDILSIGLGLSASSRVSFFMIGENKHKNTKEALEIIKKYKNRSKTDVYVFSSEAEDSLLIENAERGKLKIRIKDQPRALIYDYLYKNGEKLFKQAEENMIRAMIVGMGNYGMNMLKTLSWFGQIADYKLYIAAYDMDPCIEDLFAGECPELYDPKINGRFDSGDAQYEIKVSSVESYYTKTFATVISDYRPTFVFIDAGNDEKNIHLSAKIRQTCERIGIHPGIVTVCSDPVLNDNLTGLKNQRGQQYDIEYIGNINQAYSAEVAIATELEEKALKHHLKWGDEAGFWASPYNYNSSIATTMHSSLKQKMGVVGAGKKESELTEQERDELEKLEHRRWNAYMRSEGYVFSGDTDPSSRNDLGKMHHNLVPFNSLSEEDKRKDSKVGSKE